MYQMHRYYARKPPNVIAAYIEHYTNPNDIVLDPFMGSGPTILEAIRLGRRAVGIDLNPISKLVVRSTALPVDIGSLNKRFDKIRKKVKGQIDELYRTRCSICGEGAVATKVIWESNGDVEEERPLEIFFECPSCGKGLKEPDLHDGEILDQIGSADLPETFQNDPLVYGAIPFLKSDGDKTIGSLFTKRAIIALSTLLGEIERIPEGNERQLLLLTFSASLQQTSRNVIVIENRGKMGGEQRKTKEVGSWGRPSYWTPKKHFEVNVWNTFENRFRKTLRGKQQSNELLNPVRARDNFGVLELPGDFILSDRSATNMSWVPGRSIDYILTDPPYGESIQYYELSTLWTSWLGLESDPTDEIVINRRQGKGLEDYSNLLQSALTEANRVLKENGYLTLTFHSNNKKVWNAILESIITSGFELEKILYQPPLRPSATSLTQPFGSAVGDYFITSRKAEVQWRSASSTPISQDQYEEQVVDSATRILVEKGEPLMFQTILNEIIVDLHQRHVLLLGDRNIDDIMKEHIDREFTLVPVEVNERVIGYKWWVTT